MLDLASVLLLAQACAPSVPAPTLAAVAHVESGFDALAIGVNSRRPLARRPRNPREAVAIAQRLIDSGADVDLGLAQINSRNLAALNLSLEAVFDPCRNLAAAAAILADGYRPDGLTPAARQAALRAALSRYNTGHPERGLRNGYVGKVEAASIRLGLSARQTSSLVPAGAAAGDVDLSVMRDGPLPTPPVSTLLVFSYAMQGSRP